MYSVKYSYLYLTGVSLSQAMTASISYVMGRLSFIDTPTIFNKNETVKGKVGLSVVPSTLIGS